LRALLLLDALLERGQGRGQRGERRAEHPESRSQRLGDGAADVGQLPRQGGQGGEA
jgi:hypothetical protein